jgi:mono/diheme cytochrome c family protein
MPAQATNFNDEKLADIMTFLRSSWGNTADAVKADDVAAARAKYGANLGTPCSESQLMQMPAK